jgi:hypothetical protein
MPATPRFELAAPDAARLLGGMVDVNLAQIKAAGLAGQTPVIDGLRDGSIVYAAPVPNELWLSWAQVRQTGRGNCKDLAPAVAAELTLCGQRAVPVSFPVRGQPGLWHVVVAVDTGRGMRYVDPSVLGGMV